MNHNQGRRSRRSNLHGPSIPPQNAFDQWYSLREHRIVSTTNGSTASFSDSTVQRPIPSFPRLDPFLAGNEQVSSSLTTRNVVSRARLVGVLQEALDISNSIALDATNNNDADDTGKERSFRGK
jgi:hypothetical protein